MTGAGRRKGERQGRRVERVGTAGRAGQGRVGRDTAGQGRVDEQRGEYTEGRAQKEGREEGRKGAREG